MNPFIILLFGFLFSALFSGAETGAYTLNRIRLRVNERKRRPTALRLTRLLNDPHIFVFTVLIGNNIAVYLLSKSVTDLYLAHGLSSSRLIFGILPWNAEMAATLTLMFPLFFFAEVAPKNLFRKKADLLMYRLSGLLQLLVWIFYPLTWPLKHLYQQLLRNAPKTSACEIHRLSPDGLKEYFSTGEKEGLISPEQSRMMDNVSSMHRVAIRTLATPLRQSPTLPAHATVADFRKICTRHNTSYAILLQHHRVVGFISIFSIVPRKLSDETRILPYATDPLLLPETQNLKSAFYRLRRHPRHLAVLIDARNHPIGLIHLQQIARYISGFPPS